MLDRKTKDYDASDELLEDRIKHSNIFSWIYYFAYTGFFLLFAYISIKIINMDFSALNEAFLWKLLFITMIAGFLFAVFFIFALITSNNYEEDERYYKILLFLRKQKGKK
ncbi:MAG TPA: hypothetical protein VMY59_08795 [Candidatus Thermoplasmatota archaeon]|nr:hypothetical protein [Candidatus Thermoplasmatota archaeon]